MMFIMNSLRKWEYFKFLSGIFLKKTTGVVQGAAALASPFDFIGTKPQQHYIKQAFWAFM